MSRLCGSVLITGANRGIGLGLVKAFLNLSPSPEHVIATARSPESASDLIQLQSNHSNLHVIKLNVTDFEAFPKVVQEITEILDGKGLNILVNNAGIFDISSLEATTAETMMSLYKTNTVAPFMLTQSLLPLLKKATADHEDNSFLKGAIFNVSGGLASVQGNTSGGYYAARASKAALNVVNKSLSVDLKSCGIIAVVLHPGHVQTRLGGSTAPVSIEECVAGLMKVISSIDSSKTGMFLDFKGEIIPW